MTAQRAGTDDALPLTGERTVPGIDRENYWFRRHEAVYTWIADQRVPGTVVEAGCGEGYGAELLRRGGARVIAVDYDEAVLGHVRTRYPLVETLGANLVDLPLPDESADAVVSLQVIEHLWDLSGFLAECHRVLRPGGRLVLSTPNRLTFSPGLARGDRPTNPFHVEEFDSGQLRGLLRPAWHDVRVDALDHGPRLVEIERRSGGWVQRQVDAILADAPWPEDLLADVRSVAGADFTIRPATEPVDPTALDLIVSARKPA